ETFVKNCKAKYLGLFRYRFIQLHGSTLNSLTFSLDDTSFIPKYSEPNTLQGFKQLSTIMIEHHTKVLEKSRTFQQYNNTKQAIINFIKLHNELYGTIRVIKPAVDETYDSYDGDFTELYPILIPLLT